MNNNLDWVHHDSKTFDEEKFMEDVERKYIEKHTVHIKGYTQKYVDKLNKQITQLTNNWNELEKDINNQLMMTRKFDDYNEGYFDATLHYYNKMKEITGDNK